MDLVGPLPISEGMKYIFTVIDRYSRWVEAIPLPSMTAQDCALALLRHWISRFGVPSDITTDQGRQFCSDLWQDLHRLLGIKSLRTTAYHPQANGMVERLHRTLKERIMARSSSPDWMTHLPFVLLGIRSSVREDSSSSPAELLYGDVLRLPGQMLPGAPPCSSDLRLSSEFVRDLKDKMSRSIQMPVLYHGHRHSHIPADLLSAEQVFVRVDAVKPPLTRPYEGPYTVLSKSANSKTFTVDRMGRSWVVSIDRLKPAFSFSTENPTQARDDDADTSVLESAFPVPRDTPPAADPVADLGPVPVDAAVLGAGPIPPPVPARVPPPQDPVDGLVPAAVVTHSGPTSKPPDRYQA